MNSRAWIVAIFVLVQSIGIGCSWVWQHVPPHIGVALWGTALVLLIPGNFLASWMVESSFWENGMSLAAMGVLSTLILLPINALAWLALVKAFQHIWDRRKVSKPSM